MKKKPSRNIEPRKYIPCKENTQSNFYVSRQSYKLKLDNTFKSLYSIKMKPAMTSLLEGEINSTTTNQMPDTVQEQHNSLVQLFQCTKMLMGNVYDYTHKYTQTHISTSFSSLPSSLSSVLIRKIVILTVDSFSFRLEMFGHILIKKLKQICTHFPFYHSDTSNTSKSYFNYSCSYSHSSKWFSYGTI